MSAFKIDAAHKTAHCDPNDAAFYTAPYPFYAALHAQAPAFYWEEFGHWCFAGWDNVNALFRDKRFGRQILHVTTRENLGWPQPSPSTSNFDAVEAHSLLNLEPPEHTRLRTLVNRAFVSRQVEHLRPQIARLAHQLIDGFEGKQEVELIDAFAAPIPVLIISEMLGVPSHMAPQLLAWSHDMVAMYAYGATDDIGARADLAARDFADYLKILAAEKRKAPGEDLISHMITTEHRGQSLTDSELVSTAVLLLNAGHEATVHQAGNGVRSILQSGCDPADLFATQDQTAKTVEECLRFDAPLHMFKRYALADIELEGGIHLKQGEEVGLLLGAANRDPARFAQSATFDPKRTDGANISFGAGIHFCIGAPLARIELQEALSILFKRLPTLRLQGDPVVMNNYHFHGLTALNVVW